MAVYERYDHIVVHSDSEIDRAQGVIFTFEDRTYVAVPVRSLGAADVESLHVDVVDADGTKLTIGDLRKVEFRVHPSAPETAIADVAGKVESIDDGSVPLPALAGPDAVDVETITGTRLGSFWREQDATSSLHETRAQGVGTFDSERHCILLDPSLPPEAEGAPVVNESGEVVGIGKSVSSESGFVDAATSATSLATVIREGSPFGFEPLRDWENQEGLQTLVDYLQEEGLRRIVSWRIVQLEDGRFMEDVSPPVPEGADARIVIAVLSESASDDLNLALTHPGPPVRRIADDGEEPDAAVGIPTPSEMLGATLEIVEESGASNARVLVVEAAFADERLAPIDAIVEHSDAADEAAKEGSPPGESEGPDEEKAADNAADEVGDTVQVERRKDLVAVIPLHGTIGFAGGAPFFTAEDFRRALEAARRLKPARIILDIESPGGRLDTKEQILRLMLEAMADHEQFVAIVRDAGSAAALIALGCQEILVFPGARIGSAVTIAVDETGTVSFKKLLEDDPELAAKLQSFSDAMDNELAIRLGRSVAIGRAMKERAHELWWSKEAGFTDHDPGNGAQMIDGPDEVLTLTASTVEMTGLGKRVRQEHEVPQALGLPKETRSRRFEREMGQSQRELEILLDRISKSEALTPEEEQRLNDLVSRP